MSKINLGDINKNANKNKFHSPNIKPTNQENLTDVDKKKKKEYQRTNRTIGIDQETHDLLTVWQAILSDEDTLSFKNVIKALSNTYLDSLSIQKKNNFEKIKKDILNKQNKKNPYQL